MQHLKLAGQPWLRLNRAALIACWLLLATPAANAVAVGDAAPDCTLSAWATKQNTLLSQYKGKVVYVDFWASWCGPCAQSFPFLNTLHQQFNSQGLQIVGVNMDEKNYTHADITRKIIGAAMQVHSRLGNGFQEVIYQRVLASSQLVTISKLSLSSTLPSEL